MVNWCAQAGNDRSPALRSMMKAFERFFRGGSRDITLFSERVLPGICNLVPLTVCLPLVHVCFPYFLPTTNTLFPSIIKAVISEKCEEALSLLSRYSILGALEVELCFKTARFHACAQPVPRCGFFVGIAMYAVILVGG